MFFYNIFYIQLPSLYYFTYKVLIRYSVIVTNIFKCNKTTEATLLLNKTYVGSWCMHSKYFDKYSH